MKLDHVLMAVEDIARAAAEMLGRYGLASVAGGDHPEWGTGNRLVPVGPHYVELFGIRDRRVAERHPVGQRLIAALSGGDRLGGVCLEPDDMDALCARLRLRADDGRRVFATGEVVEWRMAGAAAGDRYVLPFFFAWGERRAHRLGIERPAHPTPVHGIVRVEIGADAGRLAEWTGAPVPELSPVSGPPGVQAIWVKTEAGLVEIRNPLPWAA